MSDNERAELFAELTDWRFEVVRAMQLSDHEGLACAQGAIAMLEELLGITR